MLNTVKETFFYVQGAILIAWGESSVYTIVSNTRAVNVMWRDTYPMNRLKIFAYFHVSEVNFDFWSW